MAKENAAKAAAQKVGSHAGRREARVKRRSRWRKDGGETREDGRQSGHQIPLLVWSNHGEAMAAGLQVSGVHYMGTTDPGLLAAGRLASALSASRH